MKAVFETIQLQTQRHKAYDITAQVKAVSYTHLGLWILVPLLMIAAGVFQTVKCLLPARNKKGERGQ